MYASNSPALYPWQTLLIIPRSLSKRPRYDLRILFQSAYQADINNWLELPMEFPLASLVYRFTPSPNQGCFVGTSSPLPYLYLHDLESLALSQETSRRLWQCDSCSGSRTMLHLHAGPVVFKSQGLSTNINSFVWKYLMLWGIMR